jgi:hypothetical protein
MGLIPFTSYGDVPSTAQRFRLMLGGSWDYTSCPDCGTSVRLESLAAELHRCDGRQRVAHVIRIALAEEVDLFEHEWHEYLDSPHGRFEVFYAARAR